VIELPKCPHCGKLLVGKESRYERVEADLPVVGGLEIAWMCPTTMEGQTPIWVSVEDSSAFRTRF